MASRVVLLRLQELRNAKILPLSSGARGESRPIGFRDSVTAWQGVQVIVFSFSKRECEALAMQMAALDLNSGDEKKLVDGIFHSAMDCLSDDDKRLPQIQVWACSRKTFFSCTSMFKLAKHPHSGS